MRTPPKTKAGKSAKVGKVIDEYKTGDLKSSSGDVVTNPKQAVAIALSESGQAKPKRPPSNTKRLSDRLSGRVSERMDKR